MIKPTSTPAIALVFSLFACAAMLPGKVDMAQAHPHAHAQSKVQAHPQDRAQSQTQSHYQAVVKSALPRIAKVIDLTHVLNGNTPTFFAEKSKTFNYATLTKIEKDGFGSGAIKIPEHFGTHIDAPSHFISGGKTIDKCDAQRFVLPALVIDVSKEVAKNPDYELTVEKIKEWEKNGEVGAGTAVLLSTRWQNRYGDPKRYRNIDAAGKRHSPGFSSAAVDYLVNKKHVYSLGIDTLSIDPGNSMLFSAHQKALSGGAFLIENLANLDKLPARGSMLFCGPLPIEGGTGAPARILATTFN